MASKPNSTTSPGPEAAATAATPESSHNNARPARRPRPPRPNYKHIHRFPLPVSVHPLPPLIPHNPLSIVSVLLSYLTYFVSPPHHEVYPAYFDPDTSSVHVTDEKAIRALWEMGFFGKGTLSRSEPSWLEREKKRRGLLGGVTSEEATRQRRSERRELKLERARMERVAIEERLKAEAVARETGVMPTDQSSMPAAADGVTTGAAPTTEKYSLRKAKEARIQETRQAVAQSEEGATPGKKAVRFSPVVQAKEFASDSILHLPQSSPPEQDPVEEPVLENEEHLQLSNEEAFFLVYGLGALQVFDRKQNRTLSSTALLSTFCQHSYFPPRNPSTDLHPDDPFMVSYVVYHHFRSLGWVVRSGVKFGVDYILYNRGPVFSHAEFAVVVLPSYEDPYWSATEERQAQCAQKQARSWWWFHCVNRVQAQVKKTLVVCYVEIPPPASADVTVASEGDIGALLGRYQVREVTIRRWVPNRTRD
ncbi:tRNA splicing endonuclease subunit SEN2 [Aspergillus affinis]|uniref:tRNA splicing endonuclease subunit SEN2 n=1 Tax=Aspergillus affinis TaxID=1070780 RepID=UPI0022FF1069|nr:SEN2 subunit of tRNA-splicing endonuclease [Aspergillus affinis]KAI9041683.1 SEN2 subunit of tRNA-splicing endonuclease [Aspergillus affinis]